MLQLGSWSMARNGWNDKTRGNVDTTYTKDAEFKNNQRLLLKHDLNKFCRLFRRGFLFLCCSLTNKKDPLSNRTTVGRT